MCGIVVLYRAGGRETAEPMLAELVHRGPDDAGTAECGDVTLGARRLAVIDVAGGHQPTANETNDVVAVLNGEIYNFIALRDLLEARGHAFRSRSDTEVLVHGYEEWGWTGLLERLRGMFAFAIADRRMGTLYLARDRMGVKPLYAAAVGGGWAFASEIKALFRHPRLAPDLDEPRIPGSLANRFVTGPATAFRGVRKVLPGEYACLSDGAVSWHRYWEPPEPSDSLKVAPSELQGAIRSLVLDSVRARLIADVPLGLLLSGGIDSSVVAAAMASVAPGAIRTFTVRFEPASGADPAAARAVASHLGTRHEERVVALDAAAELERVVWHLDEPLGDAAALPTLLICRAARESVTVVLSGEGADELFLGYSRYRLSRLADRLLAVPDAVRRPLFALAAAAVPGRRGALLARLARLDADSLLRNALWMSGTGPELLGAILRRPAEEWRSWYVPERGAAEPAGRAGLAEVLRRDLQSWLVDDVLLKLDKMSMAASLEAREPFLDQALVEFVCRLPLRVRLAAASKSWLRGAFARDLPARTVRRAKKPFAPPLAQWLRAELGARLADAIRDPAGFTQTFLDGRVASRVLERHRAGRADHGLLLWTLLVHEVWWRRFFVAGSRP